MKVLRKAMLLALVLIMVICHISTRAEETPNYETIVNQMYEYDYYVSVRKMNFKEARSAYGISEQDYNQILHIEKNLAELKEKRITELKQRGMDDEQISVLRSYDGSKLENNPQLRSVLATLTATLTIVSSSSSAVKVKADWSWNSKPMITSAQYYETAAFRWKAYNSNNTQITASYSSSGSDCFVTYYDGSVAKTTQWKPITVGSGSSYVFSQFTSVVKDGDKRYWAKTGYMIIKITGSNIARVDFGFGYNHGISSTPATVSLDNNLGFNYSNGFEMAEQSFSVYIE